MNRNELIACALYFEGDYGKVAKAFYQDEQHFELSEPVDAITILDEDYPLSLKELTNPPLVLFYKGHRELIKGLKVAIVGSRKPCAYALKATSMLSQQLSKHMTIVSGMAKGIDACAHSNALAHHTIGVLGCGIDYVYPSCNARLYNEMAAKQLLLSEYPNRVLPLAYHFPFRNRIIAGLSEKLYVMQAGIHSGTLITVNEMLNLNRDIYALPYNALDLNGIGTNQLINDGANMILHDYFK